MNKIFYSLADANPFVTQVNTILGDMKGWILGIVAAVTLVVIAKHGIQYQQGGSTEKSEAMKSIKSSLYMGGGIYMLVWLATHIMSKMAATS